MTMEFHHGSGADVSSCSSWLWEFPVAVVIPCLLLLLIWARSRLQAHQQLLPPGSQGWLPLIGETLEYARPNQALSFMQRRVDKYGEMFQSHLFGDPIVVSCNPRTNQFICQQEFKLFRSSYPRSFISILGKQILAALPKDVQKKVRGGLLTSLHTSTVRSQEFIRDVSTIVRTTLHQWNGRVVRAEEELAKMAYTIAAKRLLGLTEHDPEYKTLQILYSELITGLISIPINFPRMAYHKSMRAKLKIAKIIDDIITKRQDCVINSMPQNFLDALIKMEAEESSITRDLTRDSILSVLFAGHDTVSKALTCAMKFLLDNEKVVEKLKEEQLRVQDHIKKGKELTYDDCKAMTFSNSVILETLRLTNIAPGVFREAVEDVDIDGVRIPKGCKVLAYFSLNHLDPNKFQDPFRFNPWRWEEKSLCDTTFMPFGGGPRLCPGYEFAKLQVCIFLHHLVLNFRFEQVEEDNFFYSPYIHFKKGLPTYFKSIE